MNTRQQEKEGLAEYTYRFKQEKRILKSLIWKNVLGSFVRITKKFKKLDEVDNV